MKFLTLDSLAQDGGVIGMLGSYHSIARSLFDFCVYGSIHSVLVYLGSRARFDITTTSSKDRTLSRLNGQAQSPKNLAIRIAKVPH
ncbi:hypothetical protein Landi51_05767 [Colletotrichum acutatum]